ncbi:adenosylcobinamide-GDP ribazoletransferase [Methanoculleus sp. FWC-SCC1]|uniref:Adenosylcobinamide-GDP ribazoletransferase n=1 Tax=Methanoculleus frigidifontis TaxID=2584085 RepID=A0ABT8MBV3_9EURY|nr:adenosylcobinamide-GDP ribazoletransferase [Methanoculleus sp. FWC-SCC1]MDN7025394.1 adenosylcobinamide-GDP ribazoletransferase [Methanoculleus sp. FWC-SCC1]
MKPILALLQFCTTLPLGQAADFEQFARRSYLYPLAGYVTGGIAALLVFPITSPALGAAVALAAVLILSGANHFDGLLDLGDGLMAHGSSDKRIGAMTDRNTGAGAVAAGIVVTLLAFAGLQTATPIWAAILIAEVCAKLAMAWMTVLGTPFRTGIHSYLHGFARRSFLVFAAVLALPLLLLPLPPATPGAAIAATGAIVVAMLLLGRHLFGGVNGDVVGATHEITRAGVLVLLALL